MFKSSRMLLHSIHKTFYKRPLPPKLIAFSSPEGKQIFKETLEEGGLEGYFELAEQYQTQSEPAFCGLGTLAMALNSLQLDPSRTWKGPWRWFSEEMFNCCISLEHAKTNGVTIEQFWCMAKCNGAEVKLFRHDRSSEEEFRERVIQSTHQTSRILIASFSRKELGQTGDGHYSPIGGYNKKRDLVLMLDVARFKYPSYWLPLSVLWRSMGSLDSATQKPRGFFVLEKPNGSLSFFYKLFLDHKITWRHLTFSLTDLIPEQISKCIAFDCSLVTLDPHEHLNQMIKLIFIDNIPQDIEECLQAYNETLVVEVTSCHEHKPTLEKMLQDISQLKLYDIVKGALSVTLQKKRPSGMENPTHKKNFSELLYASELATLLLIALPIKTFQHLPPAVLALLQSLRELNDASGDLREEIARIRYHLKQLCATCGESACVDTPSVDASAISTHSLSSCLNSVSPTHKRLNDQKTENSRFDLRIEGLKLSTNQEKI